MVRTAGDWDRSPVVGTGQLCAVIQVLTREDEANNDNSEPFFLSGIPCIDVQG